MNTENTNDTENDDSTEPDEGTPADRRPIGFWLRAVDGLITAEFAAAFEAEGISRRDWMLLNALAGDVDAPWLSDRLARKGKRLGNLVDRGWIAEVDGTWTVTDEGRAAKARLGEVVEGIRSRVAGAVSPEEFATTMASLEAIARELGWEEGQWMPRSGRGRFGRRGFGRPGFGPRPEWFGAGFGHGGFSHEHHGFGPHDTDAHGEGTHHGHPHHGHRARPHHDHPHHGHPHHRHDRAAQKAYERGFNAGFQARSAGAAPSSDDGAR